jgi:metal-responsive CopG/Arc/MetJ family transcriptional regulator
MSPRHQRRKQMAAPKQISVTFGKDELELLTLLDERRKDVYMTRSAWIKNQIRKEYATQRNLRFQTA